MSDGRPNILFIFADDWGRYASAYAAHETEDSLNHLIQTPAFDRIAREGALCTNAFVPAPSCTPCRSAVLSGRYFWQCGLGAILQGAVWDEEIPSYPLLLEQAGYHIGYTYKVWAPGRTANAPYGGPRTAYHKAGTDFGTFSQTATERAQSLGVAAAKQTLLDEVRDNFQSFLQDGDDGKPWCYWWGPTNTHRKWQRGSGKALWDLEPDHLKGRLPAFLPDVHDVREDVADYLGECLAVDAGIAVLLKELEERGELDNTFILVSGDHGIPGFPRGKCNLYNLGCEVSLAARWPARIPAGRVLTDFINLHDVAPSILEAAGEDIDPEMSAQSLLPILCTHADGRVDPQRDHVVIGRERHVAAAREGNLPYPQRAIRTDDFLYIRNFCPERWPMGDPKGLDDPQAEAPSFQELCENTLVAYADLDASPTKAWMIHHRGDEAVQHVFELGFGKFPAEELYDLNKDPDYMHNVAQDPDYATAKADLANRLLAVLQAQNDPRVCDSTCRFEQEPFTNLTN